MEDKVAFRLAIFVFLVIGALSFILGYFAHNIWVGLLVFTGILIFMVAANNGREEKYSRYFFYTLLGLSLLLLAMWLGKMAGRFWWTPVWLTASFAYFTTGFTLKSNYEPGPGNLSIIFGLALVAFSIIAPWFIYPPLNGLDSVQVEINPETIPHLQSMWLIVGTITGGIWSFLIESIKSWWGIVYLLLLVLLGLFYFRKRGWLILPLLFLLIVGFSAWLWPIAYSELLMFFTSSPATWMYSWLIFCDIYLGSTGWGSISAGLFLVIILLPVYHYVYKANQNQPNIVRQRQIFGTTAAMNLLQTSGTTGLTLIGSILTIVLVMVLPISAWVAYRKLQAVIGPLPFPLLGIPDLSVPHFRPVWQWQYFILPVFNGILGGVLSRINIRYQLNQTIPASFLITIIASIIVGLFIPAGAILVTVSQSLSLVLMTPVVYLGIKIPKTRTPLKEPVIQEDKPEMEELLRKLQLAALHAEQEAKQRELDEIINEPDPEILSLDEDDDEEALEEIEEFPGEVIYNAETSLPGIVQYESEITYLLDLRGNLGVLENGEFTNLVKIPVKEPINLLGLSGNRLAVIDAAGKVVVLRPNEPSKFEITNLEKRIEFTAINSFGVIAAFTTPSLPGVQAINLSTKTEQNLVPELVGTTCLAFSKDNRFLGIGDNHGVILVFDMSTRKITQTLKSKNLGGVLELLPAFENGWVALYDTEDIALWDSSGVETERRDTGGIPGCLGVDWTRNRLAYGNDIGEIVVVDQSFDVIYSEYVSESSIEKLIFSPDGNFIITVDGDGVVRRLNITG